MIRQILVLLGVSTVVLCGCSSSDLPTEPLDPGEGAVTISVEPAFLSPAWTLAGQDSVLALGFGTATVVGIPVQECTLTWGSVDGWGAQGDNFVELTVAKDDTVSVVALYGVPFADSQDQAVENLRTGYVYERIEFLQSVLDPSHLSFLQQSTQDQFPGVGEVLDVAEELLAAERMFEGLPTTNSNEELVPGVLGIEVPVLTRTTDWVKAGGSERLPGAYAANFDVSINVSFPGDSTIRSVGEIRFFADSSDSLVGGEVRQHWKLVGQDDLTESFKKGVESAAWGWLRALFL